MFDPENRIALITQVLNADGPTNIEKNLEAVKLVSEFLLSPGDDDEGETRDDAVLAYAELITNVRTVLS